MTSGRRMFVPLHMAGTVHRLSMPLAKMSTLIDRPLHHFHKCTLARSRSCFSSSNCPVRFVCVLHIFLSYLENDSLHVRLNRPVCARTILCILVRDFECEYLFLFNSLLFSSSILFSSPLLFVSVHSFRLLIKSDMGLNEIIIVYAQCAMGHYRGDASLPVSRSYADEAKHVYTGTDCHPSLYLGHTRWFIAAQVYNNLWVKPIVFN